MQGQRQLPRRPAVSAVLHHAEAKAGGMLGALGKLKKLAASELEASLQRLDTLESPPHVSTRPPSAAAVATSYPSLTLPPLSPGHSAASSAVARALAAAHGAAATAASASAATALDLGLPAYQQHQAHYQQQQVQHARLQQAQHDLHRQHQQPQHLPPHPGLSPRLPHSPSREAREEVPAGAGVSANATAIPPLPSIPRLPPWESLGGLLSIGSTARSSSSSSSSGTAAGTATSSSAAASQPAPFSTPTRHRLPVEGHGAAGKDMALPPPQQLPGLTLLPLPHTEAPQPHPPKQPLLPPPPPPAYTAAAAAAQRTVALPPEALTSLLARVRGSRRGLTRLRTEVCAMLLHTAGALQGLAGQVAAGVARQGEACAAAGALLRQERSARRGAEGALAELEGELSVRSAALGSAETRCAELELAVLRGAEEARVMRDRVADSSGAVRCVLRVRPLQREDVARGDSPLAVALRWTLGRWLAGRAGRGGGGGGAAPGPGSALSSTGLSHLLTLGQLARLLGWWGGGEAAGQEGAELCKLLGLNKAEQAGGAGGAGAAGAAALDLAPSCLWAGKVSGGLKELLLVPPVLSERHFLPPPQALAAAAAAATPAAAACMEQAAAQLAAEFSSHALDRCFGPTASQAAIFSEVRPFLDAGLRSSKGATVLAYGASGSGKSHSLCGSGAWPPSARAVLALPGGSAGSLPPAQPAPVVAGEGDATPGLLPRALCYVWDALRGERELQLAEGGAAAAAQPRTCSMSIFEVYNEDVRDLLAGSSSSSSSSACGAPGESALSPAASTASSAPSSWSRSAAAGAGAGAAGAPPPLLSPSKASGTGRAVPPSLQHELGVDKLGLCAVEVMAGGIEEALAALGAALQRRALARTVVNSSSSRSHCIVRLVVRPGAGALQQQQQQQRPSVIQLVDLAGAENVKESRAAGAALAEACAVNGSLAALGEVLAGVARGAPHIPHRASKLTRVLEPSLRSGGRCLLLLTTCLAGSHRESLVSTLRFAGRVSGGGGGGRVSRAAAAQALMAVAQGQWEH